MVRTKTQTLLANSPTFSHLNLMLSHISPLPVADGPEFKSIPVSTQTSQAFPAFWFQLCIWPYLPDSQLWPGTVCTHTFFFFFCQLETKPKPGIHLELEMYFPLNTQMPVQSKLAPHCHQRNGEQYLHTHNKGYTLLETFAFKTTCLVIFKLGESFKPWTWYFIKLNTEVTMLVPQTTLLHEHTHMQAYPFSKSNHRAVKQTLM